MMIVQLLAEDVDSCKNYRILTSPLSNLKQTVDFFSFFFYIIYNHLVINVLVQYWLWSWWGRTKTVEAGPYRYNLFVAVSVWSANRNVIPTIWKTADVIPMYKEDDETGKRNQRSVRIRAISLRLTYIKNTKNYHRPHMGAIYSIGLKWNKSREAWKCLRKANVRYFIRCCCQYYPLTWNEMYVHFSLNFSV